MVQLQILNKILLEKNLDLVINNGLTKEYFNEYVDEYNFIVNHYDTYGNVPDDETMAEKFTDFEFIDVEETNKYLVETIKEEHLYNIMVPILNKSAELMQNDADQAIKYLLPKVSKVLETSQFKEGTDIMKNVDSRLEEYERRKTMKGMLGITTGLAELDDLFGGWLPGEELVCIIGRVNQGKSWILQYFLAKAWENKKKVLLYSGEMSEYQVGFRTDTLITHLSNSCLMRGTLDKEDEEIYISELKRFKDFNTPFIVVTPKDLGNKKLTVSMLDNLIKKYDPDIIGIDQVSLMEDERRVKGTTRADELTHLTEDMFALSEKYKKPILVDCQANRKATIKDDDGYYDTPELEDAKDSDGIVANSSRVITIAQTGAGLKLSIKKNRYGSNNRDFNYYWDIDKGKFDFLPSNTEAKNRGSNTARDKKIQYKNKKGVEEERQKFSDETDVF